MNKVVSYSQGAPVGLDLGSQRRLVYPPPVITVDNDAAPTHSAHKPREITEEARFVPPQKRHGVVRRGSGAYDEHDMVHILNADLLPPRRNKIPHRRRREELAGTHCSLRPYSLISHML